MRASSVWKISSIFTLFLPKSSSPLSLPLLQPRLPVQGVQAVLRPRSHTDCSGCRNLYRDPEHLSDSDSEVKPKQTNPNARAEKVPTIPTRHLRCRRCRWSLMKRRCICMYLSYLENIDLSTRAFPEVSIDGVDLNWKQSLIPSSLQDHALANAGGCNIFTNFVPFCSLQQCFECIQSHARQQQGATTALKTIEMEQLSNYVQVQYDLPSPEVVVCWELNMKTSRRNKFVEVKDFVSHFVWGDNAMPGAELLRRRVDSAPLCWGLAGDSRQVDGSFGAEEVLVRHFFRRSDLVERSQFSREMGDES